MTWRVGVVRTPFFQDAICFVSCDLHCECKFFSERRCASFAFELNRSCHYTSVTGESDWTTKLVLLQFYSWYLIAQYWAILFTVSWAGIYKNTNNKQTIYTLAQVYKYIYIHNAVIEIHHIPFPLVKFLFVVPPIQTERQTELVSFVVAIYFEN